MNDNDEYTSELVRLWRVYKTTKQMLFDRGYVIADSELDITLADFRAKFADANGHPERGTLAFNARPSLDMVNKYTEPPTASGRQAPVRVGTIRVVFNGDQTIGVKAVRAFAHEIVDQQLHSGIIITSVPVSSACHKIAATIKPKIMEIFQESDLLVNITQHELVPKHVLLSTEERAQLLDRYRLKANQLPRIHQEDPVARYLGLQRGDVVKIIRKSTTAGRYASYRVCV